MKDSSSAIITSRWAPSSLTRLKGVFLSKAYDQKGLAFTFQGTPRLLIDARLFIQMNRAGTFSLFTGAFRDRRFRPCGSFVFLCQFFSCYSLLTHDWISSILLAGIMDVNLNSTKGSKWCITWLEVLTGFPGVWMGLDMHHWLGCSTEGGLFCYRCSFVVFPVEVLALTFVCVQIIGIVRLVKTLSEFHRNTI